MCNWTQLYLNAQFVSKSCVAFSFELWIVVYYQSMRYPKSIDDVFPYKLLYSFLWNHDDRYSFRTFWKVIYSNNGKFSLSCSERKRSQNIHSSLGEWPRRNYIIEILRGLLYGINEFLTLITFTRRSLNPSSSLARKVLVTKLYEQDFFLQCDFHKFICVFLSWQALIPPYLNTWDIEV